MRYFTYAEIIELHVMIIEDFGGLHGIRDEAGLSHINFHDTRHEAITRMVRNRKLPVEVLAKITGHKTINILINTYYNPNAQDLVEMFNSSES